MLKTLIAVAFASLTTAAIAAPVVLNQSQNQTFDGQNFTFSFNGLSSAASGGTFILRARGDYDGATEEALSWNLEGVSSGGPVGGFVNGNGVGGPFDFATVYQPLGNIDFQRTYTLTLAELNAILADGSLTLDVDLDASVGLFDGPNFVEVTFLYDDIVGQVPEPASIALLGLALAGLGAARRTAKR